MAKRVNRDDIDQLHDYGLHIPTRTVYIGSVGTNSDDEETGTDHFMMERAIKNLLILESLNQEAITIIMNNIGGDEYHGNAIYDAIQGCKSHITIKVFGNATSMGSIILQAADLRVMSQDSIMMLHYGTISIEGHSKDVINFVDLNKNYMKWMEDIFLVKMKEKNPLITREELQKMINFDKWLTPKEALNLGLIDEISNSLI